MTCEHLKPLLESAACCRLMGEVATQFARGQVPHEIITAMKMGRMTALQKPDGGVRGIVVGDVMRRLVARTLAQQFTIQAEEVILFNMTHVVHTLTSKDNNATILSVDGVGAYDFISRRAMFQGVADMPDGDQLIPFIRHFYEEPSTFLWEDEVGEVHKIRQGEGGEQGDPLMPLLFCLGQHRALVCPSAFEGR